MTGVRSITHAHGVRTVTRLAAVYPWSVEPSEELDLALAFLGWPVSAAEVTRAGYTAGLGTCLLAGLGVFVTPQSLFALVALLAIGIGVVTVHAVHSLPLVWATARRTSALGAAPDLVSRAVLSMRLAPTPERAAVFAADNGDGMLAADLAQHVERAQRSGGSALSRFGDAWADLFPCLRRSLALVEAAGATPAADRDRLLDRALAVVLDGTREEMQEYANAIRSPTTALYAFGVMIPMALVALLPAGGAVGLAVTPPVVVLLYNVALPLVILVAGIRLLARRPLAFPPPNVTSDHPEVEDPTRQALLAGSLAAVLAWFVATPIFPAWGPPIAAVGFGLGIGLTVQYRPVVTVYKRIQAIEAGLSDALALVGRRVANGEAVESAIDGAADELGGEMADVLAAGARRQRQLQLPVRRAFLGNHGALATVPSARVRGSMALVSLATTEGRPAGGALLALAEHVDDLQEIEREARYSVATVCRTLRSTAMVFGPMVGGATVALAGSMSGQESLPGGEQSLLWLGGPVGLYVLCLAVLLTALATGLTRGLDRSLVGYRIGLTLITATATYLGTFLVVGMIA